MKAEKISFTGHINLVKPAVTSNMDAEKSVLQGTSICQS